MKQGVDSRDEVRHNEKAICIKVVVERKGRDESTEGRGVHDEEQRTENRAPRNTAGGGMQGR